MKKLFAATAMLFFCNLQTVVKAAPPAPEIIHLSEAYELANIVLALTPYGKSDQWEVNKNSVYYNEVIAWFDQYADDPLLAKVNYSREGWERYLSFRTDGYAFDFAKDNRLVRTKNFYANKGFNPFEENIDLLNQFVKRSRFRQFYKKHDAYYKKLAKSYLESQRYPEMLSFLQHEFGNSEHQAGYAIVLSPLVGRMNCHRKVAGIGTDFITVPEYLLNGQAVQTASREELASGIHMLFTELDHGFVNPASLKYGEHLKTEFDVRKWDSGSGYEKFEQATFNEYMTWGVYDLYLQTYFADVARKVSTDWALQNESRGFYASSLFNRELASLYQQRKKGETIKDLYPALLKRLAQIQNTLRKPFVSSADIHKKVMQDTVQTVLIHFSEPMVALDSLDIIKSTDQKGSTAIRQMLDGENNRLEWSEDGTVLSFNIRLISGCVNTLMFNKPWGTSIMVSSAKGIDLSPYTVVHLAVKN